MFSQKRQENRSVYEIGFWSIACRNFELDSDTPTTEHSTNVDMKYLGKWKKDSSK